MQLFGGYLKSFKQAVEQIDVDREKIGQTVSILKEKLESICFQKFQFLIYDR